jgi:NAD(P)-dependent dehydrogenase (short-subunit alcohol dehydrogenase family)
MGKAAMEALAYTLAKEESRNGIHVNIVAPGVVETEMGRRLVKASGVTDMRTLDAAMPFGRVCQPEDVAAAVCWFVSDAASYITGQRVVIAGGVGEWAGLATPAPRSTLSSSAAASAAARRPCA